MDREINDYFREITQNFYLLIEKKLNRFGLVKGQAQLLLLIRDNEGCTQKDLAEYYNVKYSSMSERLNKLEKLEYITRVHEDDNFKNNRIYITNNGKQAANTCRRVLNDLENKLFQGFTEKEIGALEKMLIRLLENSK